MSNFSSFFLVVNYNGLYCKMINCPSAPFFYVQSHIGKSLIYSMRKAFLDRAVIELVYKFIEKPFRECLKR